MSEHKILDAVTGGLIGVLHLNEDGQTITSPITGKLNYYITPPIPFGGSSDLSEYAQLGADNAFTGSNQFQGVAVRGKFVQGADPDGTRMDATAATSFATGTSTCKGTYGGSVGLGNTNTGVAVLVAGAYNSGGGSYNAILGHGCSSNKSYCLVYGEYSSPGSNYQLVGGKFCVPNTDGARVTGGGASSQDRANIEVLDWSGNLTIAGDLTFTPAGGTATTLSALLARIEALEQSMN